MQHSATRFHLNASKYLLNFTTGPLPFFWNPSFHVNLINLATPTA